MNKFFILKLTLIRHTVPNITDGTCYGISDIPVANTFKDELPQIKERIQHHNFKHIYSSPLIRCKKLAKGLFPDAHIIYDARLQELNFGTWEGMLWDDISKTKHAQSWFSDYVNTPCPNGESFAELIQRVSLFIKDLTRQDSVCIISHSGTMRAFNVLLQSMTPKEAFDLKIPFGGVVEIEV